MQHYEKIQNEVALFSTRFNELSNARQRVEYFQQFDAMFNIPCGLYSAKLYIHAARYANYHNIITIIGIPLPIQHKLRLPILRIVKMNTQKCKVAITKSILCLIPSLSFRALYNSCCDKCVYQTNHETNQYLLLVKLTPLSIVIESLTSGFFLLTMRCGNITQFVAFTMVLSRFAIGYLFYAIFFENLYNYIKACSRFSRQPVGKNMHGCQYKFHLR